MLVRSSIVAAALLAASSAGAVNLVTNGDFSTPNTGGSFGIFSPAQSGWTNAVDSGVEIGASGLYGLPSVSTGGQNLEVNANTFGDVTQVIGGLVDHKRYVLSYLYGGRPGGGTQVLDVNFGGSHVWTNTGSFGSWTPNSYTVTATGTTAVLEFKSQVTSGAPSYGNEITNVALTAVPEPATWALFVAGFGLIGVAARRRAVATA